MIDLDLHQYSDQLQIKNSGGKTMIFDLIRKKYLVFQPEEMVRQLLIIHLIASGYPKEKIQVEKGLNVLGQYRRFDIVVYDDQYEPYLLVECKSHKVSISQDTFDQIANYNLILRAPYLLVSNGVQNYCSQLDFERKHIKELKDIPPYSRKA